VTKSKELRAKKNVNDHWDGTRKRARKEHRSFAPFIQWLVRLKADTTITAPY